MLSDAEKGVIAQSGQDPPLRYEDCRPHLRFILGFPCSRGDNRGVLGSAGRTGRTRSLPGFFCLYSCHRSLRVTCFLASLLRICSNGDIPLPSTSRGKGKGAYRCPSRYAKSPLSFSLTASYSPLVFLAVFGAKPTMALTFLACLSGSFGGGRTHHNR